MKSTINFLGVGRFILFVEMHNDPTWKKKTEKTHLLKSAGRTDAWLNARDYLVCWKVIRW